MTIHIDPPYTEAALLSVAEVEAWYADLELRATKQRSKLMHVIDRLNQPLPKKDMELADLVAQLNEVIAGQRELIARLSSAHSEPPAPAAPPARPSAPPAARSVPAQAMLAQIVEFRERLGIFDNTDLRGLGADDLQALWMHLEGEVAQRTNGS